MMRALARGGCPRLSNHQRQYAAASTYIERAGSRRHYQIEATPSSDTSGVAENTASSASSPDAVFEVIGKPYSLLSVALSPSQPLHTRRGTLVALSGDPSTTVSTLKLLSPLRRALIGIPFLYQRLTSATPITALIGPKSTCTSLAVLHLTGTTDWKIAQRKALLAWTGNALSVTPSLNRRLTIAHWGTTNCTGRGLVALAGTGNLFSIDLAANESYIVHPANILAYSISSSDGTTTNPSPPQPFRFKSSHLNLQIPTPQIESAFATFFPPSSPLSRFLANLRKSDTYLSLASLIHRLRSWSRRTIRGDRLFLRFTGPTTILIQSRAARLSDVLTHREVDEIAEAPPGVVERLVEEQQQQQQREGGTSLTVSQSESQSGSGPGAGARAPAKKNANLPKLSIATVQRDGKVTIEQTGGFDALKS